MPETVEAPGAGSAGLGPFAALAVQLPSLDWTLAELAGVWATDGEMISCPLPGHRDSTPSFNLWAHDDDGVPQRFGCFGCGAKGDVLDLIRDLRGVDEQGALELAVQLQLRESATDYVRPEFTPRAEGPVLDMTEKFDAIRAGMTDRDFDTLVAFMATKGLSGEDLQQYAMDEWGWSATGRAIAMPHRDPDGVVVAIKMRAGDRRWNEVGSRFPHLYGSWRDSGETEVLICEGESDTIWASWMLRNRSVSVLGLPSGATQDMPQSWTERLAGRRVTIAFDQDVAGRKAMLKWWLTIPGVRIARLPSGEDLLSCGLPVGELYDAAERVRPSVGGVWIEDGFFVKSGRKEDDPNVPLSDFAFRAQRELRDYDGENPVWEVQFEGRSGKKLIRATDLHNVSALTRWANQHGGSWFGQGPSAQGVLNELSHESAFLPLETYDTKAGKRRRSYVVPGQPAIGPDRITYVPPDRGDARLEGKFDIAPGDWDTNVILALERLNDPAIMAAILGWLCATLIRGERAPAPPLFVAGESGAGKTHLIGSVLGAFGFNTETNLTTTTPFGVDSLVSSAIGFPVWFDEYRGGAREDSMGRLRQILRDAYNGQPSMKGGMTQNATELTEVTTWSGIVVSGEMGAHETSLRDRLVMIELNPDERQRAPFEWLKSAPKDGLGHALLTFLVNRNDVLFRIVPQGPADLPDRFRETLGFVQAGWEAWLEFRWANGHRDTPTGPDYAKLGTGRSESEDPWLEALKHCEGKTVDGMAIVAQRDDGVHIIASEVIIEARRAGIELPARTNELVAWLKRRYEVVDGRVSRPDDVGGLLSGSGSRRRTKIAKGMTLDG